MRYLLLLCTFYAFCSSAEQIERRIQFRKDLAANPLATINVGLQSQDATIRNRCVFELYTLQNQKAVTQLLELAGDQDTQVAETLLGCANNLRNKYEDDRLLLALAEKSTVASVRRRANSLTSFNFYRVNKRLRDNPTVDREISIVYKQALPEAGWKFRTDPHGNEHKKKCFEADFDDSDWAQLRINEVWETQGYPDYDGIAWYRLRFTMPEKPDCEAVELHFGAVDEAAWVWLNGIYIGQHDIGKKGWDVEFWLDASKEMAWGKENVLVVRVEDTAQAGGIWKPITIEALK